MEWDEGGPVVAGEMKSCESATLRRDLKSGQRLKLVWSGIMTVVIVVKMKMEMEIFGNSNLSPEMAAPSSWSWKTCQSRG